ncbi:MAG: phytanoyl-CoA dioxygenase family protein, partial [Myxococcota bacterium]
VLQKRGKLEADLMQPLQSPLEATSLQNLESTLKFQGVARVDQVVDINLCDELRSLLLQQRDANISNPLQFAKCLLSHQRWDMLLDFDHPLKRDALRQLLNELGPTLSNILGKDATLHEWACLISAPGSHRQNIHPDHSFQSTALCLTCFVALQPVSKDMGPTVWIPQSHSSREVHDQFQRVRVEDVLVGVSPKDLLLRQRPNQVGLLRKGACAVFDSRLLHGGTANTSEEDERLMLYASFARKGADLGTETGSLLPHLREQYTLEGLMEELKGVG